MSGSEREKEAELQQFTRGSGLVLSGIVWTIGKAWEWIFGPSEPGFWWKLASFSYYTIFWLVILGQLAWLCWTLYYKTPSRAETKADADAPPPEPKVTPPPEPWDWYVGYFVFLPISLGVLLGIVYFACYGIYLIVVHVSELFWDLVASA